MDWRDKFTPVVSKAEAIKEEETKARAGAECIGVPAQEEAGEAYEDDSYRYFDAESLFADIGLRTADIEGKGGFKGKQYGIWPCHHLLCAADHRAAWADCGHSQRGHWRISCVSYVWTRRDS